MPNMHFCLCLHKSRNRERERLLILVFQSCHCAEPEFQHFKNSIFVEFKKKLKIEIFFQIIMWNYFPEWLHPLWILIVWWASFLTSRLFLHPSNKITISNLDSWCSTWYYYRISSKYARPHWLLKNLLIL